MRLCVVKGTVPLTTPLVVFFAYLVKIDYLCSQNRLCYKKRSVVLMSVALFDEHSAV